MDNDVTPYSVYLTAFCTRILVVKTPGGGAIKQSSSTGVLNGFQPGKHAVSLREFPSTQHKTGQESIQPGQPTRNMVPREGPGGVPRGPQDSLNYRNAGLSQMFANSSAQEGTPDFSLASALHRLRMAKWTCVCVKNKMVSRV